ncbi:hypothetical protein BJ912DRAFT_1009125 [Pholiota molesta]|nr:hypothetical protein BJ912DRAFT_1009125 [Pholiota molesta]
MAGRRSCRLAVLVLASRRLFSLAPFRAGWPSVVRAGRRGARHPPFALAGRVSCSLSLAAIRARWPSAVLAGHRSSWLAVRRARRRWMSMAV